MQDRRSAFLLKKTLKHKCIPVNIAKYSRIAFLYRTHIHYIFPRFYVMIDIRYFRVIFYYYKIRAHNKKDFATDQSKFLLKGWIFLNLDFNSPSRIFFFLLFSYLAFTETCKELELQKETRCSNLTILVSSFRKYI